MVKDSRITRLKRLHFTRKVCSKASPVCTLLAVNLPSHQPPEAMESGRHLSRLLASGELGLLCKSKPSQSCACTASFLCLPAFLSGGSLFPAPAHSSHLLGSFFFFQSRLGLQSLSKLLEADSLLTSHSTGHLAS